MASMCRQLVAPRLASTTFFRLLLAGASFSMWLLPHRAYAQHVVVDTTVQATHAEAMSKCKQDHDAFLSTSPEPGYRIEVDEDRPCSIKDGFEVGAWEGPVLVKYGAIEFYAILQPYRIDTGEPHPYNSIKWQRYYYRKGTEDSVPASGPPSCGTGFGNPIDVLSRNKYEQVQDIAAAGGGIEFSRFYNSLRAHDAGIMGHGWLYSFSAHIEQLPSGPAGQTVDVVEDTGLVHRFRFVGGEWQAVSTPRGKLATHTLAGGAIGWKFQPNARPGEIDVYDASGALVQRSAGSRTYTLSYATGGTGPRALQQVADEAGRKLTFASDPSSRIASVTASNGEVVSYQYDPSQGSGTLSDVTYAGGSGYRLHYTDLLLDRIEDETGTLLSQFSYDGRGALSTEKAGGIGSYAVYSHQRGMPGRKDVVEISRAGSVINTIEAQYVAGKLVPTRFDNTGCSNTGSPIRTYEYLPAGLIAESTAFSGMKSSFSHDARGLVTQVVHSAHDLIGKRRTVQTDWHADFALPLERRTCDAQDALVGKTSWTYNARGQVLTSTATDPGTPASTRISTTTYCEAADVTAGTCPLLGLVTSVNGPRTDVTDMTQLTYYSSDEASCAATSATCAYRKGDLWKVTNALGQVTETMRYDGAGRVLSAKDPNGVITDLEYHPRGWLTASKIRGPNAGSEADDAITRYEYTPTGLVSKITQPDGSYITFGYDAAHRLTAVTDNAGNQIVYTLDNYGQRTKEDTKDSGGVLLRTLSRAYNQLGQLQTGKDAYNHATGYLYDTAGSLDRVTDALGAITDHTYDPLGRLIRTQQDVSNINAWTEFEYDALDRLTQVTDPKGLNTQYQYNGLGDLTQLTSPDTGVTGYTYDSAGNRKTQTDARNETATYSYDALNRVVGIAYSDTALNVAYTYDTTQAVCQSGETFSTGRLTRMDDGSGNTRYCYDRRGNVVRKVQTTNGQVFTLVYGYTLANQLSSVTYPSGLRVDYTHNALGQPSGVTVTQPGQAPQVLLTSVTYYPFGPAAELEYGDGRRLKRTYNQNYQPGVIEDVGPDGLSLGYEFDAVGNLIKLRKGDQSEPPLRAYVYDKLGRLTETRDGTTNALLQGYTYDATGNRTSKTDAGATQTYTYPTTNHRLSQVGATARTYDAVGNTAAIGGTAKEFIYTAANRMGQVKQGGSAVMNYAYNGIGEQTRRYPTTTSTAQTYASYDEAGHAVGVYDHAGARIQEVIWLGDLPVGVIDTNKLHYIQADHLGTPRNVIDPTVEKSVWVWQLGNEAFGDSAPNQDPDNNGVPFVFDLRFPGQRYDVAAQLNYNYYRSYESSTGRYVQSDPVGLLGGISTYVYVNSAPLKRIDRLGLSEECADGGCAKDRPRFKVQHDAARHILHYINPVSQRLKVEICGVICQDKAGNFFYMGPWVGTISTCDPVGAGRCPPCTRWSAYWHTHPSGGSWSFLLRPHVFSGDDMGYADERGIDGYMATPYNQFWYYQNGSKNPQTQGRL